MRGIRMQLHWHENEMYRFAASAGPDERRRACARTSRLLAGLRLVVRAAGVRLADGAMRRGSRADNPDITFVLQHAGMLEDLSPQGRAQPGARA